MIEVKRTSVSVGNGSSSRFDILVDGELFCYTDDDDVGFGLMVAMEKVANRRALIQRGEIC